MEKSLHNIFCTTNATDLFDQISESSYNVLPEKKKSKSFNDSYDFWRAVEFFDYITIKCAVP